MRQRILIIAAGGLVLTAILVYALMAYFSADREPTLVELAETAMTATDPVDQERAAVALGSRGPEAIPHLRKLAAESTTNEVRAAAIYGLGTNWDFESMDLALDAMEDESPVVRSRASLAVARMLSRDRRFEPTAAAAERKRVVENYRNDWEQLRKAPYFEQYQTEVKKQAQNQENKTDA